MKYGGPIVLAVLDGVGLAPDSDGNAVSRARLPFLNKAVKNYLHEALDASGESVGLFDGVMGNSEVGHNTLGAGKILKQGGAKVTEEFLNGQIFASSVWDEAIRRAKNGTLHFAGIFSDGGVHSDIRHLYFMIAKAYQWGVRKMRVHAVLDGRDVGPFTALDYVKQFENFVKRFPDADIKIADGGGRMVFVADRYGNDWNVVKNGWDVMMNGKISTREHDFLSATEAINTLRFENPNCQDQYLPAFVIVDESGKPVGKIEKGDVLIYFDYRADRAVEIAEAFESENFSHFERGDYKPGDVYFVGLSIYDVDRNLPRNHLMGAVEFGKTLNTVLSQAGLKQLAISETVKFGHITYYFNGNSYEKVEGEEFIEVPSYKEPFETRPWMKCAEITDEVLKRMANFDFVRVNFPGGDMVGHTADMNATMLALEAIDMSLARIAVEVDKLGGVLLVVADHGNAEELISNGEKKTAHTTNKVPFIIYDNTENRKKYQLANVAKPGLSNVAATVVDFLDVKSPVEWAPSLIEELDFWGEKDYT